MTRERTIAGIACREVLADLSAYLDGDLPDARRQALEAHVRACGLCARFGGVFAAIITRLRTRLATTGDVPEDVARRLHDGLRRARG